MRKRWEKNVDRDQKRHKNKTVPKKKKKQQISESLERKKRMKTFEEKSEIENGARKSKKSDLRGEEVFFALTCAKLHMDVLFGPTGTR